MQIITGVFDSTAQAEQAVLDLLNADVNDERIGVVVRDPEEGALIADDLGREYRSGDTLAHYPITSPTDVYEVLPDSFEMTLLDSGMPKQAVDWDRQQLLDGKILLLVDATGHTDDVFRILRSHNGMMYEGGARLQKPWPGQADTSSSGTPGDEERPAA